MGRDTGLDWTVPDWMVPDWMVPDWIVPDWIVPDWTVPSFGTSRLFLNLKIFNAGTWLGVLGSEWTGIASDTKTMH
jgi:hypothetical protein